MKVPVYERSVGQEVQNVVDPGREAFGVGVAQANKRMGAAVQDVGLLITQRMIELQEREDARQVQEAETNYRKALDDLLYNPETGLTNKKLSDALGVTSDYDEAANKLKDDYLKTLAGAKQKEQFGLTSEALMQQARGYMLRHETEEVRKGEEVTFNEFIKTCGDAVIRDPDSLAMNVELAEAAIDNFIDVSRSEYADQRDSMKAKMRGQFAALSIGKLLSDGNTEAAKEIYEQNQEQIIAYSPKALYDIKDALKSAEIKNIQDALTLGLMDAGELLSTTDFTVLITKGLTAIDGYAAFGMTPEAIEIEKKKWTGQMVTLQANAQLSARKEEGIEDVRALLEANKENMDGETITKIETAIENAGFNGKLDTLWESDLSVYKLEDGYTYDLNTIYAKLEKQGYAGSDLERAKDYIKSKVSEAEAVEGRERAARQNAFENKVAAVVNRKGTKQEAIDILNTSAGFTEHERMVNRKYIEQLFALPETRTQSNRGIFMDLWKGVRTGERNQKDIDDAFLAGHLAVSDWESLSKTCFEKKTEQKTQSQKIEEKRIADFLDLEARKLYPKDSVRRDEFKYYIISKTEGKPLDAVIAEVEKAAKKTKGGLVWEVEFEDLMEDNKVWGEARNLFSDEVMRNLKQSLSLHFGTQSVSSTDMKKFKAEIGGFTEEVIKAIYELSNAGVLITPANIKFHIDNMEASGANKVPVGVMHN